MVKIVEKDVGPKRFRTIQDPNPVRFQVISCHIYFLFGLCFTQPATYRMNNLWTFQFRGGLNLPEARTRRGNVGGQLRSLYPVVNGGSGSELWVFIFPIK